MNILLLPPAAIVGGAAGAVQGPGNFRCLAFDLNEPRCVQCG
jgi:hypothetical protein